MLTNSACSTAELCPLMSFMPLLQTGHMGVEKFVQELLTVIRVGSHKQLEEREKLLQWVQVTIWV